MSLVFHLLPNNDVLNEVGLTIRMNEDDCLNEDWLNPMTSNEFVTSDKTQLFDMYQDMLNHMGNKYIFISLKCNICQDFAL